MNAHQKGIEAALLQGQRRLRRNQIPKQTEMELLTRQQQLSRVTSYQFLVARPIDTLSKHTFIVKHFEAISSNQV
jgi:hypothetical protein